MNHCIFCHRDFTDELQPVLGFNIVACDDCGEGFKAEIERNVQSVIRQYWINKQREARG